MQTVQQVARAQQDTPFLERFIEAYQPFILRAASQSAGFAVTRSDDEYSVALMAFYEAVRTYNAAGGSFGSYARLVIDRRLTDHYRAARRFDAEVPLSPQIFDGAVEAEQPDAEVQRAVVEKMAAPAAAGAAEEIEEANRLFRGYGFCFYDLGKCSPRAEKTRRGCAAAVAALLRTPALLAELRRAHALPVKALAAQSGVSRKLVERHRNYIVAAALLLEGDYPVLSEYLQTIRKEIARCGQ
ncbi:RNA polymerase sigma factor SigI [Agathobaculum sp. TL06]